MDGQRALSLFLVAVAAAGVAISGYLTSVHYSDVPLVCNASGVVNCEQVLTSSYAEVAGIPWSIGGIAWFGVTGMLALATLLPRGESRWVQPLQVGWSVIGLLTVIYLVGVEVLKLDRICLWCSVLHLLILLIFVLHVTRTPRFADEDGGLEPGRREKGAHLACQEY